MTIIHDYSPKTRTIILNSSRSYSRSYSRRERNYVRCYVREIHDTLGRVKSVVLAGILAGCLVAFWLIIFSSNISLDYQISTLKKQIQGKEESIAELQEEVSALASDEKILEWAQENGFVKVSNLTYLNLSKGNLAQVENSNLK